MKRIFKCKDCEIVSFRCGSRLQNGPEWAYRVIYHAPNGKSVELAKVFYTKESARQYIRKVVSAANNSQKTDSELEQIKQKIDD